MPIGFVANISKIDPYLKQFRQGILRIIFFGVISFFMLNMIIDKIFEHFLRLNNDFSKKIFESDLRLKTIALKLNPHFLLNAMNNISNLIHTNPDEADNSLIKMSKLLRSYIDKDDMISLKQELQFTEDYFYIQNLRYKNINYFMKQVDSSLLNVSIPKFSLQLLIENAFKHAYDGKNPLLIKLKIYKNMQGNIVISMLDNGKGFKSLTEGFGLSNLRERLMFYTHGRLTYGSRCGVTKFKIELGGDNDIHDY
jgi:sensor histidine kinase YesM